MASLSKEIAAIPVKRSSKRHVIGVGSPGSTIKSLDPEVDCGLFAAVALDLKLDSLSLVE